MADESEKRFNSIMDKLFHAPKSKPISNSSSSSSGVQLSRGKRHLNLTSALSVMDSKSRRDVAPGLHNSTVADKSLQQAPLCRPWDRGDFLRRLATFKSMMWFGKPKVVNAVNCARRGWVNVDMDIIACEACGSRLLFSTSPSWTQQQVEKAALVFSLKLDNGHKLLCPWIDNACDEKLAQFPPMPAPDLIVGYSKRSSALLQLLALPAVSSSTLDNMRSPQLEQFLKQPLTLEYGNGSADISRTEYIGAECDAFSANLYYQALKLISLCGWEPRSLSYMVDCNNQSHESAKDATPSNISHLITNGQDSGICFYSAGNSEIMEANDPASGGEQFDPRSVVLDCRLCGASVGLWAFSAIPRPVELFRLIGYTEVNGGNDTEVTGSSQTFDSSSENHGNNGQGGVSTAPNNATMSKDRLSSLNMTIAGGPPPTKQNFKATISLPIIGQNLRARISSEYNFRNNVCINLQSDSRGKSTIQEGQDHVENTHTEMVQPEGMGLLKRKRCDEDCSPARKDDLPYSNNTSEKQDTLAEETTYQMSLDCRNVSEQGSFPEAGSNESVSGNLIESTQNIAQESGQSDKSENEDIVGTVNPTIEGIESFLDRDTSLMTQGANSTIESGKTTENSSSMMVATDDCNLGSIQGNEQDRQQEPFVASLMEGSVKTDKTSLKDQREGNSDVQNTSDTHTNVQASPIIKDRVLIPEDSCGVANYRMQPPSGRVIEFDPFRQHRHFCPWISSTGGSASGWQQTLSALQRRKECSPPSPPVSLSSDSVIEVDDPVASVRKLFMSPSPKRVKSNHKPG